jgi:hypothetical protein
MHALDYLNCVSGGYCVNLAALGNNGVNYLDTPASKPSDSFPGLMALMTGGSPRTMSVNYDVAYDRAPKPLLGTIGNGNPGGPLYGLSTPIRYEHRIRRRRRKQSNPAQWWRDRR